MKTNSAALLVALASSIFTTQTIAEEYEVDPQVKERLEAVLGQSGGTLTYFDGPSEMVGIGVSFLNGKQMVVYATPDGATVFSGVAIDVNTGRNLSNGDMQKLPPPKYDGVVSMVSGVVNDNGLKTTYFSEGNPDSPNKYYVFVDPKCPYCHKTYNAFLSLLANGNDLVVHYIPVGILGPESENIAKEMLALPTAQALDVFRAVARREAHLVDPSVATNGTGAHGANLAIFRELQFDAVPVVISDLGGEMAVRRGMIEPDVLLQELQIAAVNAVASRQ